MSSSGSGSDSALTRASAHALSYHNASSTTSLYTDLATDVDADGFLESGQRAGGPHLCSLPTHRAPIRSDFAVEIETTVGNILDTKNIAYVEISIKNCISKVCPEDTPTATIVILAANNSKFNIWRKLTREIHSIFSGFTVEVIDPELEIEPGCFPICKTDGIYEAWDAIRRHILNQFDIFDWTGLECWRYGRCPDPMGNPPTITISIREDSSKLHHTDTQRIRGILAQFGQTDVSILFMKDTPRVHASNRPLPMEACTQLAQPGVSIGIRDKAGSSTLGGMIELRMPDSQEWHKFGLTCCHAVYPPDGHCPSSRLTRGAEEELQLWEWQPNPFQKAMACHVLKIDQPSAEDIQDAANSIDETIEFCRDDRYKDVERRLKELEAGSDVVYVTERGNNTHEADKAQIEMLESARDDFKNFLPRNHLGEVVAGSGVERTRKQRYVASEKDLDCIVDWAVIAVAQDRLRDDNKLFDYQGSGNLKLSPARTLDPRVVVKLQKAGRTTQFTTGDYANVVQSQISRERGPHGQLQTKITHEHAVANTRSRSPFSEPGDSGAFVVDPRGGVIGLLIGGWDRKNSTYFTPIETVFDDIKDVTGAVEVRIAE